MARYYGVPLRNGLPIGLGSAISLRKPGGAAAAVPDPYFEYTTLLLPGNGTNGAQNNTFLDSSSNAFSITRNGNTTQGTFSPFSQTGWGNYFDGSGDGISFGSNVNTNPASSDITVEAWIYPLAYNSYGPIFSNDVNGGFHFGKIASGFGVRHYGTGDVVFTATTPALNQWTHVAVSRSGNSWYLFYNGTQVATATASNSFTQGTACVGGNASTAAEAWNGYLSNVRFVKGTALYTSNFTPSTTPLTAVSNTQLLTCQSNRFKDNSSNAYAATVFGTPSIQAFSPFNPTAAWSAATNGGSGYFDGSGDYLTVPHNAAFDFGSGDFTMEAWVYPTTASLTSELFDKRASAANYSQMPQIQITANQPIAYASATGSSWAVSISGSSNVKPYSWNHVALTRSGSTWTLWLNGASIGTATSSITVYASTSSVVIGAADAAGTNPMNGYITGSRIVKGTAIYTAAFTPPTAPLTAVSGTSLLLNYTNAGIYDATSKNDLETVGNAQISTTQSKFGGSSVYIDGTGDYLLPNSPASNNILALGSGDFTIEFWARFSALGDRIILDGRPSSTQGAYPTILTAVTTNKLQYYANSAIQITSTNALSIDTWYHIAIVRYSGSTKMYINGVNEGSTYADSTNYLTSSNRPVIGASGYTEGSFASNFYINDLRITKGIARYTANFTPPTTAFPLL